MKHSAIACDGTLRDDCDGAPRVSANAASKCGGATRGDTSPATDPDPATTDHHPKAKGEAARASVGAMTTGNAAKGAVTGAVHPRRQEGRTNRQGQ
jgi:hypothetical protein